MPKLTIDGREIEVEAGTTVLQAAESLGIEIPRFCYHERLAISGNCRMCLVEVEKMPKPVASCAMPINEGMVVHTDTPAIRKARQGVMEFLLINHPLDCPICDQGGECDLQDQAVAYGSDRGRFQEPKRAVKEKNFGPLIETWMTRCIQCTRCIRFITEIAGVPALGALGRGEHMEISTYVGKAVDSELSGNLIDLCPVGALTNKPASYTYRAWELKKTESVDAMDALGSSIRVDTRGNEVIRILPRINDDINEEWLSDRSRFACDGLKNQRIDRCYVRHDGRLQPATWGEALGAVAKRMKGLAGAKIAAVAGDQADCESMAALKDLMAGLGSPNLDCRQDGARLDPGNRASYLFNTTIGGIDAADALLIVGSNPRKEAPVLNARIRQRWLAGGLKVAVIGPKTDLTYKYDWLGDGPATLAEIAAGTHPFAQTLKAASRPMLILGQGALARDDGAQVLGLARKAAEAVGLVKADWNGFNVLHTAAARVGGLDLGFVPGPGGHDTAGIVAGAGKDVEVVFLLGADEIDMKGLGSAFVVYIGSHGDAGAHRADVVLPGAAYTEKTATYVNTEGRVRRTRLAVFPPGEAREDWKVVQALADALGKALPYEGPAQLRQRLAAINPVFATLDAVAPAAWGQFGADGPVAAKPFASTIDNFYMTDPISRASKTMAECTAAFGPGCGCNSKKTGTHG